MHGSGGGDEQGASGPGAVAIGPLAERDLASADRIMRLAFGTFIGLADPMTFMGDGDYVRTRWRANPDAAFGATADGALVGSNFATHWGSVGFFGPLTVDPRCWGQGVGSRLLEPVVACFDAWGTTFAGLCTFPQSAKHIGLYQKFGFWPRFLTAIMTQPVPADSSARTGGGRAEPSPRWSRFSRMTPGQREGSLAACQALTESIYEGLDIRADVHAIQEQGLGDTVMLWEEDNEARLAGVATCHYGAGTEAGSGACYIKFGAVRPGTGARERFAGLLDACTALAVAAGLARVNAGVNTARHGAYRAMLAHGFLLQSQAIVMQRNNEIGYNRPEVYLIDDWR